MAVPTAARFRRYGALAARRLPRQCAPVRAAAGVADGPGSAYPVSILRHLLNAASEQVAILSADLKQPENTGVLI